MKHLFKVLAFSTVVFSSHIMAHDGHEMAQCKSKDITSVSYLENLKPNEKRDIAALYQEKTAFIEKLGKEAGLKEYQIDNQDITVSANCCGNYGTQVSINFTVSYLANFDAINAFHKQAGSAVISSYRTHCPI